MVREYETLGHEAFIHRYLTPLIRDRLAVAVDEYRRRERNPDLNGKGFNPLANKYCGRHEWRETSIGMHVVFLIELIPDRSGYLWRNLKPFQGLPEIAGDDDPLQSRRASLTAIRRAVPSAELTPWAFRPRRTAFSTSSASLIRPPSKWRRRVNDQENPRSTVSTVQIVARTSLRSEQNFMVQDSIWQDARMQKGLLALAAMRSVWAAC